MARRRPNFNLAVKALLKHVTETMEEFSHIKPSKVLVVAGEARRASRGTVKPLAFRGTSSRDRAGNQKPVVRLRGKRVLYCITLRPLFFRASTPNARISTLLHELFHISPRFDGTLDATRRHKEFGEDTFAQTLRPIVRRYLRICPPELWAPFAYNGEVRVQMWLERPSALFLPGRGKGRRVYTDSQLFYGPVRMITKRTRPAKAAKPGIELH